MHLTLIRMSIKYYIVDMVVKIVLGDDSIHKNLNVKAVSKSKYFATYDFLKMSTFNKYYTPSLCYM